MTTGGLVVMTISVGSATIFFAWCLCLVLRARQRDAATPKDEVEDMDINTDD